MGFFTGEGLQYWYSGITVYSVTITGWTGSSPCANNL